MNVTLRKLDDKLFMDYLDHYRKHFNSDNPYLYLRKMGLFKWTPVIHLLFDYFLTIFSTNTVFCFLEPYLLAVFITIIIARQFCKMDICIITDISLIPIPSNKIPPIVLTKKILPKFLENIHITDLINKMYGYYAILYHNKKLAELREYYFRRNTNFENMVALYDKQVEKHYNQI